jgi:hypothetical protein
MATAYFTIDKTLIDAELVNFPVGLKITASTFFSGLVSDDWENIHCTVGGVECYVEVERWDPSNDIAVLWVRVPVVVRAADTIITVETGADNTTTYVGQTGSTAAANVWDSDFVAVYHLNQDPTGGTDAIKDSVGGFDLTAGGSMTAGDLVDHGLNKGLDFDGSNDIAEKTGMSTGPTDWPITIEAYGKTPSSVSGIAACPCIMFGHSAVNDEFCGINVDDGDVVLIRYVDSYRGYFAGVTIGANEDVGIAGVFNNTTDATVYVNGVDEGNDNAGKDFPASFSAIGIGGTIDSTPSYREGITSEARISSVARSAAWIKATYENLDGNLISYSATAPTVPTARSAYFSIDADKIDSELTDFPVGIKITASAFFSGLDADSWSYLKASVGGSECYLEVDVWDPSSNLATLWVKVPTVSASVDTVIKIEIIDNINTLTYVGWTGSTAGQSVWDSDFIAVYHLSQDPTGGSDCIVDSTENEHNLTPSGSMTTGDLVDLTFGKGIDFDGSNDVLAIDDIPSFPISNYPFTLESFGKAPSSVPGSGSAAPTIAISHNGVTNRFFILNIGNSKPHFGRYYNTFYSLYAGDSVSDSQEFYTAGVAKASNDAEIYVDGAFDNDTTQNCNFPSGIDSISIGGPRDTTPSYHEGIVGEARFSKIARSAAFIKATGAIFDGSLLTYSATDPADEGVEEPDITADTLALSESAVAHATLRHVGAYESVGFDNIAGANIEKNAGASEEVSFGEEAGAELESGSEGAYEDGVAIDETVGRELIADRGLSEGVGFGAIAGYEISVIKGLSEGISLSESVGFAIEVSRGSLSGVGIGGSAGAINLREIESRIASVPTIRRYDAYVTGGPNGLPDYKLQMVKSITYRLRNSAATYLQVIIPFRSIDAEALLARKDGMVVVECYVIDIDGVEIIREILCQASIHSVTADRGAKSASIGIIGYSNQTTGGARILADALVTKSLQADGRYRYRFASPNFYVRPGDTLVCGEDEFEAGVIACHISPTQQYMDVTEGDKEAVESGDEGGESSSSFSWADIDLSGVFSISLSGGGSNIGR